MRAPQNGHEREQNERGQNERRYKMGMSVGRMSVCRMQMGVCRMSVCGMQHDCCRMNVLCFIIL